MHRIQPTCHGCLTQRAKRDRKTRSQSQHLCHQEELQMNKSGRQANVGTTSCPKIKLEGGTKTMFSRRRQQTVPMAQHFKELIAWAFIKKSVAHKHVRNGSNCIKSVPGQSTLSRKIFGLCGFSGAGLKITFELRVMDSVTQFWRQKLVFRVVSVSFCVFFAVFPNVIDRG